MYGTTRYCCLVRVIVYAPPPPPPLPHTHNDVSIPITHTHQGGYLQMHTLGVAGWGGRSVKVVLVTL